MTKTAKFLVIGALAVLFSVCVLFETAAEKQIPMAVAGNSSSPLQPGISTSGTQVVEKTGMTVPDVIVEAELEPEPKPVTPNPPSEVALPPKEQMDASVEAPSDVKRENGKVSSEVGEVRKVQGGDSARTRTYVARKNDSFWKIAKRIYGSGAKWRKIWLANRDICPRPGDLRPGMKLVLPNDAPTTKVASADEKPSVKPRPTPGHYYIVRKGDILGRIAKTAYGRSFFWRKIYECNKDVIEDPNSLRAGTKIFIPRLGD